MPTEENRSIDKSYDFSHRSRAASRVRYRDIQPEIRSEPAPTSEMTQEFVLPNHTINLGKSALEFVLTVTAQGAGNRGSIRLDAWSMIKSIQLRDSSDAVIYELTEVDKATKTLLPMALPLTELKCRPQIREGAYGVPYSLDGNGKAVVSSFLQADMNTAPVTVANDYDENIIARYSQTADNGDDSLAIQLPFSDLFMTPLGVNKMLYWGRDMKIVVVFREYNKFAFKSTGADLAAGLATPLSGIELNNSLRLSLALEADPALDNALKQQYRSGGFSLTVPVCYVQRRPNLAATTNNQSFTITPAHGSKTRGIAISHFYATETVLGILSNVNLDGDAVSSIRLSVDGTSTTEAALTYGGAFPSVYKNMREVLKNSSLDNLLKWGHEGAVHFENFGVEQLVELYTEPCISRGANLCATGASRIECEVTTPAGQTPNTYFFILGEDTLHITPKMIALGPQQSTAAGVLAAM